MILLSFLPLFSDSIVKADHHFSSSFLLSFDHPKFTTISLQNNSFLRVSIKDCMMTSNPGTAELPVYSIHILIPERCFIQDITVSFSDFIDYSDLIQTTSLLPAQTETPFTSEPTNPTFQMNHSWYQQQSFQPSELVTSQGKSYMKGYPVETIQIHPLQYNPGDYELRFYEQLELTVTFSQDQKVLTEESESANQFYRKHHADKDAVKELVLNPESVETYSTAKDEPANGMMMLGSDGASGPIAEEYPGGICTSSDTIEYVIVTDEQLAEESGYAYAWSDLLDHRHQLDGLTGEIVTIQEILDCTDYYNETSVFNDSAARLREFCKDAYLDWNTEYVLLGGTWDLGDSSKQIVPCRIFKDREETHSVKTMPSDLYFSNLDGDWYFESESIWGGGRSGANDKLSELSVGRIPVWNLEMVSHAVQKIIWYDNCNDESFLRSAGFLGGDLGWDVTSKAYMEEIRLGNGEWSQYTGFEEWNTNFPSYMLDTSGRYYDADFPSESQAVEAWKTAINNNEFSLISHLDHGSRTNTLSLGDGNSLSNSDYFLGTSQACLSGRYIDGESGASTFLSSWDDGGAFAMILNTGYGYGSSSSTRGKSQLQHKIFWDYFFENQTTDFTNWRLGKAMQYTKDVFSSNIDLYHVYTYVWYSWNLFGDPAQQIRLNERLNNPPVIESSNIQDNAQNVSVNLSQLSVTISDEDADLLNWSIETSPDIGSNSSSNEVSGQKKCSVTNLYPFTTYTWFVNVSDGLFQRNQTYMFTTGPDPTNELPVLSNPFPLNQSVDVDVWTDQVSVQINDSTNDTCSYSIEGIYLNNVSDQTRANTTINTSCLTPLPFETEIRWSVTIDDHRSYPETYIFNFTTRKPYTPSAPSALHVISLNRTAIQLNWTKNSSAEKTIVERNQVPSWEIGNGTCIYNNTENTTIDTQLTPGTTYYYQAWGWNTTDPIRSQNHSSVNITTDCNHPVVFSSPLPQNNSINCSLNLTWAINLTDADSDQFNWTISLNNTLFNTSHFEDNGTKMINLTNLSYYTDYTIWVNATDGYNTTNESFHFRTKLPNDTEKPKINAITLSSEKTTDEELSGWDQIQCTVTDNFRLQNISVNITIDQNMSEQLSLTQIDQTNIWSTTLNTPLTTTMNTTLYATDLNGNTNQTTIPLIMVNSTLGQPDQNPDWTKISTDLSQTSFTISQRLNQSLNYSIQTTPSIGHKTGNITGNETINLTFSDLSHDTTYDCQLTLNPSQINHSRLNTTYRKTLRFTTESAPEQPSQDTSPPSNGGGGLPPMPPSEPEEEVNLPPERPLPPQGSTTIQQGEQLNIEVSSWDANNDHIRYQIDWGDETKSSWSEYVSSNVTKQFTHNFETNGKFSIMVRAQDEPGLNSSWSKPITITVIHNSEKTEKNTSEFEVDVNNETKETSFQYNNNDLTTSKTQKIQWDFGDGTILEGTAPKHHYQEPGEYTVTVTITDETGNVTMKTFTVTIPGSQQEVKTSEMVPKDASSTSMPWILILVGIVVSIISVIVLVKYRIS